VQGGWREQYVQQYELATFEVGVVVGGRGSACSVVSPGAVCSAVSEEGARKGRGGGDFLSGGRCRVGGTSAVVVVEEERG